MKLIDLSGRTYGRLTVLSRATPPGKKHVEWLCRCVCGKDKIVNGDAIKRGTAKSCGCLRRDMGSWNRGVIGHKSHMFRGHEQLPHSLFSEIRYKADQRGIEFNVSIEYLWNLYAEQRGRCALSGLPISFSDFELDPASLDRIDSSLGYIEGNLQWVARRINFMKQRSGVAEFITLCQVVAEHNK